VRPIKKYDGGPAGPFYDVKKALITCGINGTIRETIYSPNQSLCLYQRMEVLNLLWVDDFAVPTHEAPQRVPHPDDEME
jgi:hypothetical protein